MVVSMGVPTIQNANSPRRFNMVKIQQYDINALYKVLKKHDVEILKYYNDDTVSDKDYFFYGINSDIISSCLNVLTNYLSGNIESAGVDLSCRTIIEAMVILRMDASGKISDDQKRIYRYQYAYVDLDNFHSLLKDSPEAMEDKGVKKVLEDKGRATEAMIKHFECSLKDLKDRKVSIDDPCFYLKQNLQDDIRFSQLLKEYPICGEDGVAMYEFFSLFIHPRCEMDPHAEEAIMEVRKIYIDQILNLVFNYLKECGLLSYEESSPDFDHDFFYNPLLANNVHNVKEFEKMIHLIKNEVCDLPTGYDAFTWQFLERVRYLVIDMMTSISLGYNEHTIASFKSLVEEYSVFFAIGSVDSQEEFDYIKHAYWVSSRMQIDAHFEQIGMKERTVAEKDIKDLYDNFYKERYGLDNYKKFYWELRRNSLYFLEKAKKSYNKYVRALLEDAFTDESQSKDVMTLYRMSKDMGHASGYNFNATSDMVVVTAHKTLFYSYKLIIHFLLNASLTLEEHGFKTNVKSIVDFLNSLIGVHELTISQIYKKHDKIDPSDLN